MTTSENLRILGIFKRSPDESLLPLLSIVAEITVAFDNANIPREASRRYLQRLENNFFYRMQVDPEDWIIRLGYRD